MKRYSGYTSFSYIEEEKDYRSYTLAAEVGRVPSRAVEVTAAEEEHVRGLMRENLVISLHEHPTRVP
ncbi:MAG: dipeptidase, partial [Chloroflexota bacterium]